MIDLSNYNIYTNKDGRMRAYNKATHKVTSYPRLLMELSLGRPLLQSEDVHHRDENPLNNDIENLEVIDHREHDRMHAIKYYDKTMICPICNKEFTWTARQQAYAAGSKYTNGPFCSRSCSGTFGQRIQAQMRKSGSR